ncbi:hypothetical protein BOTCAL_0107g00030 [Botryotinia calthae]|uniref:Uncharacterized protein n=1 Tax=Botryotinia calthae TaxID=38488 RepID=A0A4Y8D862_9HELO|nr:hypothetical protein BOTCAL_0107g00030 [Botryotinia calthae]
MTHNHRTQREDSNKSIDYPIPRHGDRAHNHAGGHENAEDESVFKALEQTRDFFKESYVFDFFGGGAPGHVDFEEMTEQRLGDVHGESTEEDGHQEEPFEVFEDWLWGLVGVLKDGDR